jgi:hypothetical protein
VTKNSAPVNNFLAKLLMLCDLTGSSEFEVTQKKMIQWDLNI